jgi:uncharacterized protein (TIGR02246 family)
MRNLIMVAVSALALAGCNFQATPGSKTSSTSSTTGVSMSASEADQVVNAAYADFTSGDAVKMMAHYAPGAVVIDAANNLPSTDRATITKWTADFAALKPSDLTTNPRLVQSFNDDTIVSSGVAAFLADVGGRRQRVSVRYTHVFEKQADGKWLIVAEHNSIPPQPVSTGL